MQSPVAAQCSLWFSFMLINAPGQKGNRFPTPLRLAWWWWGGRGAEAIRCYDMLWHVSKIFKTCSCKYMPKNFQSHVGLSRAQYAGTGTSYQLFPVYQEEREVRFTTPQAQCPDLVCTFWVTHCVDVPHKCHRDPSGYCPNSCQLSRCMSLWFFRRFSKTFEGSRRWWNAQRKGSVLMSSAADCCHYLS